MHGILIGLGSLELGVLLGHGHQACGKAAQGAFIGVDFLHRGIGRRHRTAHSDDFLVVLPFDGVFLTGNLHGGLQRIVTAGLLHADLLEGIVAEFVILDKLVLDGDAPQYQDSDDGNNDNKCHSILVYFHKYLKKV